MNSISESGNYLGSDTRAEASSQNSESAQIEKLPDAHQSSEEDIKFVSELGWLAAASVTVVSIAAGVGLA